MNKIIDFLTGLVSGPVNYVFSKTTLGKLIDGKKTEIGFSLLALNLLIAFLIQLADLGSQYFAGVPFFANAYQTLIGVQASVSDIISKAGSIGIAVGVYHDKLKRS